MNIVVRTLLSAFAFVLFTAPLHAAEEHGTSQEAIALVKKAIDFYKKNGAEKTFDLINKQDPMFKTKDLYLIAQPLKQGAPLAAHGSNPKLLGKDLSQLKDADGVNFTQKLLDTAQSKEGKGWVDYKWPNPVSGHVEQKSTYVERVDDLYFGCGIYK
jgi:signal transduction histidine kinase